MAVYKPTLCYPFSNGVDIRTGVSKISDAGALEDPAQCLTCRVETSNVAITGYSVALYSTAHEQIFPVVFEDAANKLPYVSPISELQFASLGYDRLNTTGINSGVNGSTLRVPFFRAARANTDYPRSLNAIYYQADYVVKHLILDDTAAANAPADYPAERAGYTNVNNADYWKQVVRSSGTYLVHTIDTDPAHNSSAYFSPASYVEPSDPSVVGGALFCDGEPLAVGDLVGVIFGAAASGGTTAQFTKGGIYEVALIPTVDGEETNMLFALKRRNTLAPQSTIVVWQGMSLHNTAWEITTDNVGQRSALDIALWRDTYGNVIELDSRGANYQWEITLYQGTTAIGDPLPILPTDTTVRATYGGWVDYTTIGPQWFDNIVTGGQIMGSTPERLQLADRSERYLPAGTDSDPLVLQDTFCSIFPRPSGAADDYISWSAISRFPVHDYDARYGHIYPYAKTLLGLSQPNDEQWCAFYEHSTNPQEILDTDIVDYVYNMELPLSYWHVTDGVWHRDNPWSETTDPWAGVSVTERYLVLEGWTIDSQGRLVVPRDVARPTEVGGQILLTAQSNKWQNGVWQIKTMEAVTSGTSTSKKFYLTRAAGYTTWADFVGRIVYALQPTSMNYTSLAAAGAATLWNYQDVDAQYGRGDLVFSPERPILLFREKLWHLNNFTGVVRSVDLVNTYTAGSYRPPIAALQAAWQVGDYVADAAGRIFYVATCTDTLTRSFTLTLCGSAVSQVFIYVVNFAVKSSGANGVDYTAASEVFTWAQGATGSSYAWTLTWELHRAKILKNNTTFTYISPWVKGVVDARMSMKLLSPGTAVVAGSYTTTDIVRLQGLNDIVYRIDHAALDSPMEAYNASNIFIPYRYNICSYFRTSEPNPFVAYERPYLRLFLEQDILTNLATVPVSTTTTIETSHPVTTEWVEHITTYIARKLNIGVEYQQFNHTMWESYEWKLYSGDGETLLQDTGRRYDGLIQTTFYGLANELSANVPYWAAVIVENSVGDVLEYRMRFEIAEGEASQFVDDGGGERCWFTAAYDCNTQSNLITFQWATPDSPTITPPIYSVYRREYEVYEQPGQRFEGYRQSDTVFTQDAAGLHPLPRIADALYEDLTVVGSAPAHVYYTFRRGLGRFVRAAMTYREFKGAWEPVVAVRQAAPNTYIDLFRDFNISNGRSYQYIIYPAIDDWGTPETVEQTFANYSGLIWEPLSVNAGALTEGTLETSPYNGGAVLTKGDCWSMVELVPEKSDIDAPLINQKYRVDNDNIWLFRYDVETGEQAQNLARNEFANLGRYPKFGFGRTNYASGSVSAQLGSELVCSSKYKYIERLPKSRITPMSTNEKAEMLKQWQAFVYSRNPKLLRDIKGQSWIVQILSSSDRPRNYYPETPDTISFQWKEVGSPQNVIIYGDYSADNAAISKSIGTAEWSKVFAGLGQANAAVPEVPYRITWGDAMWSFDTLNTGTEARIKLGAPPTAADDYTYAISGAATGGVGKIGTITDHNGTAVTLPTTFDSSALYLWVLNANAPLRLVFPVEATITASYTDPYVLVPVEDTELVVAANHTAYDLRVITNNAMGVTTNPQYVVAGSGSGAVTRLDFIFPSDYSAPQSGDTSYIVVTPQGATGSATSTWVRDDASHGHLLLSAVSAPLVVSVTGLLRSAAPTLQRQYQDSAVLVWSAVPNATNYKVLLDGNVVATVTDRTYDYTAYSGATPAAGQHFWTVYAETSVGGAISKESAPVIAQWYALVSECYHCSVNAGSSVGVWDYDTARISYTFDAANNWVCPWQIPYGNGRPTVWEWTYYNATSGALQVAGMDITGLVDDGYVTQNTVYISVVGQRPLSAPTISQYKGTIRWRWYASDRIEKYRVYADWGADVFVTDITPPTSSGTFCQFKLDDYLTSAAEYEISVVALGDAFRGYSTSPASNTITVTQAQIYADTENGAEPDESNPDMVWSGMSTVLKYSFDGTAYVCPTTGPTVTGATGTWTKLNDLLGQLTISDVTDTTIEFTISGVAGTVTSYTTYWDNSIESSGTTGTPAVAWDVTDSTLVYSFNSNGAAYSAIYVDEMGCLYYTAGNTNTMVYNALTGEWTSTNYRTLVSTVDPDTVFLNAWAPFYDVNTDGVAPVPHTVQWNFIMYYDGLSSEDPDYWSVNGSYIDLNFRSNNQQFTKLLVDNEGSIYYRPAAGGADVTAYDYITGWTLPAYRTIICEGDPEYAFPDSDWNPFYRANTVETRWRPATVATYGGNPDDDGTWWDVTDTSLSLNFNSNGNTYSRISTYAGAGPGSYTEIILDYDNTMVCDYQSPGWTNENYRIITTASSGEAAFNSGDWKYFYAANALSLCRWNATMTPGHVAGGGIDFAFLSNGVMYASMYVASNGDIYYSTTQTTGGANGTKVYDAATHSWANNAYRIITTIDTAAIFTWYSDSNISWEEFYELNTGED